MFIVRTIPQAVMMPGSFLNVDYRNEREHDRLRERGLRGQWWRTRRTGGELRHGQTRMTRATRTCSTLSSRVKTGDRGGDRRKHRQHAQRQQFLLGHVKLAVQKQL